MSKYVFTGGRLGEPGVAIRWSIVGAGVDDFTDIIASVTVDPASVFAFDYLTSIRNAFDQWRSAADVDFVQLADSGARFAVPGPDFGGIRVAFGNFSAPGLGFSAFPLSATKGSIYINTGPGTAWTAQSLYLTVLHELGHALGLDHPTETPSIMQPSGIEGFVGLQANDVLGIKLLYPDDGRYRDTFALAPDQVSLTDMLDGGKSLLILGNDLGNDILAPGSRRYVYYDPAGWSPNRFSGVGFFFKVFGGAGDDTLRGSDYLFGGPGRDILDLGTGSGYAFGDTWSSAASALPALTKYSFIFEDDVNQIYRLYHATLARAPDEAGWNYWAERLSSGTPLQTTPVRTGIVDGFLNSDEFRTTYGNLDNTGFVTLLYRNVLQRAPDAAGLANWVGKLEQGGQRSDVVVGFSDSLEFQIAMRYDLFPGQVYRLFGATLAREPDAVGFDTWRAALMNRQKPEQVASGFVDSAEFRATYGALDDTGFVTLLYRNVLDRAPDSAGLQGWLNALASGQSRTSVVLGFSDSTEYQAKTNRDFLAFMRTVDRAYDDTLVSAGFGRLDGGRGTDTYVLKLGEDTSRIYATVFLDPWDIIRLEGTAYRSFEEIIPYLRDNNGGYVNLLLFPFSLTFANATIETLRNAEWQFG